MLKTDLKIVREAIKGSLAIGTRFHKSPDVKTSNAATSAYRNVFTGSHVLLKNETISTPKRYKTVSKKRK